VKKPGWNPKKGMVLPKTAKPSVATPNVNTSSSSVLQTDSSGMEQAPQSADQLQSDEPAQQNNVASLNTVSDNALEEIDLTEPKIYKRPIWKSGIHWIAFSCCMMFNISVISVAVHHHMFSLKPLTWLLVQKELIADAMTILVDLLVLPSLVCEAQRVEAREDCLIVRTLLYKCQIPWTDIRSVFDPMFLKFAIIRTPRFFQLINKRDLKHFDELLHIIKLKAGVAAK
jgi:hypothetical protein